METIIREFVCISKTQERETHYNFKALIKCAYDKPYRIKVFARQYICSSKTSQIQTELYFDKREDMAKEFEYHYNLCKNNLFTDFIKIIK